MKYINQGEVTADWHDLISRAEKLIHAIGKDGDQQAVTIKDKLLDLVEKGSNTIKSNKDRALLKTHDAIHFGLKYAQQRPLQVVGVVGLLAASVLVVGMISCRKNQHSSLKHSTNNAVR